MTGAARVDAAMNIFGKPYQTALSLLSLLRFSGRHIDRVYLQFEPQGSRFDPAPPYAVAEYLGSRAVNCQPGHWLRREAADSRRFPDPEYRFSIRYEYAFEHTDKPWLFVLHNDVLIKRDIVGAMLAAIGDAFAIGRLGQCWNCPASREALVRDSGCGEKACSPERYREFRPDYEGLKRLYALAVERGVFVRPYWEGWETRYAADPWPLPECRINEWGCLVNVRQTRPLVQPQGEILPFGAYESCGSICLDIAASWFRDLHRHGLHARHMDILPYLTHWVGNDKMLERRYLRAEENARRILEKNFKPFAAWCRERENGLFAGSAL